MVTSVALDIKESEVVTTIPIKVAERGIVGVKVGSKDNYSVYDYKRGVVMHLSRRERVLLDAWKRSFNYAECVRVLKVETGIEIGQMTCRRWLGRSHVVELMMLEMKEEAMARGYTEAKWKADGIGIQMNGGKVGFHQVVAWKELGRACGFYDDNNFVNNNVQINITQADGRV